MTGTSEQNPETPGAWGSATGRAKASAAAAERGGYSPEIDLATAFGGCVHDAVWLIGCRRCLLY
ncbi:MAG TPA: hypothetical protein VN969_04870 [Streptosporangiaceae bacterium]|nr:hypothetical protein [Streptosporangiaceae bacterium]